jgi:hypothetical protein
MQPGVIGFIKWTNPFAIGTAKSIEVITFIRIGIPFIYTGIIGG